MASYAALVSLMSTMDQIHNHPCHSYTMNDNQIESLGEKVAFLLDFVETIGSHEAQVVLEGEIASAALAAENVIESHLADQMHADSISFLDLCTVIQDMGSITKRVMELKRESGSSSHHPIPTSSRPFASTAKMVGFDDELLRLLERLTGQPSDRRIIPVLGMAGVGKTTLAKHAYEHSLIVERFDIRMWVTVSQTYNVKEILLQLLYWQSTGTCCTEIDKEETEGKEEIDKEETEGKEEIDKETEEKLGLVLYKRLWGRRYLVVLDDIWSIEAWDKVKLFFPDNSNGSRIVVTTRQSNMTSHFDSPCFELSCLDEDTSWELFCGKAFDAELKGCPPELEDIGREIVKKCKGLPLSIVVIGGILKRSDRVPEYWTNIARDLISILNSGEDGDDCFNILSLSYTYLPARLRPCFLYMGVFPEDDVINVSQLIKLWVAEGFIKPSKAQSSEEIAQGYLYDLVDRNLILKHKLGSSGKIRTCKIHDLMRDVCIKVARNEKFVCMMDRGSLSNRRVFNRIEYTLLYLEDISLQVKLRYLAYGSGLTSKLPLSLSLFWNMQTIIISGKIHVPPEIWEMRQLKHLDIKSLYLPDPPPSTRRYDSVLQNLQTLKNVTDFMWSEEACKRVINVKKLNIRYHGPKSSRDDHYCLHNLCRLHKLESLTCSNAERDYQDDELPDDMLQNLTFPSSVKKLRLQGCDLHSEDLTVIGLLPHLEILKLEDIDFLGPEWNPVEGEFLSLKFLLVRSCTDLVYWNAEQCHFPVLETLVLEGLEELDKIPLDIGEISTLGLVHVVCCSESAAISAMRIAEEQESFGNEGLQVRVEFLYTAQVKSFWNKVEEYSESFTRNNFQVKASRSSRQRLYQQ